MIAAEEALERLRAGNQRYASDCGENAALVTSARRNALAVGQQPFAIVLGCSDSRVPAELIFDQGLGDLFVIRVAGNIVAPSQIGSVEFAVSQFGTQLVVVMGHSRCGAVQATLDELQRPLKEQSPNLRSIVDRIRPSVETLVFETDLAKDQTALLKAAIRANVRAAAQQLYSGSAILESLVRGGLLRIVAAEYCLDSGLVDFFDHNPLPVSS